MSQKTILFGLVNRRERWGLSWRGWLLSLIFLVSVTVGGVYGIRPFLATTVRVHTDILVMEGWLHVYAVKLTATEFNAGHYRTVYTTGGPAIGLEGVNDEGNSLAAEGAWQLKRAGVAGNLIQSVPAREVGRDRTYNSALALREWFRDHGVKVSSFNIVTEDAHARRTRFLFQKAFGPKVDIGIISIRDPDYEAAHWWRYSEGVRIILSELIAYMYAVFLFKPTALPAGG